MRTRLHQFAGTAHGLVIAFVVAAKGHIANHPRGALGAAQATGDAFDVVAHGLQTHAHGAAQPLANHAQRVADQNRLYPSGVSHGGKGGVIRRQHGDFFAAFAHFLQARQADGAARGGLRRSGQRAVRGNLCRNAHDAILCVVVSAQ